MARARADVTAEDLQKVVAPFVFNIGWLRYDENKEVSKAKVIPRKIKEHQLLLKELRELQHNMSFKKHTVLDMFRLVYEEKQFEGSPSDKADWVLTMTSRLRNMCRCAQQTISKAKVPKWATELCFYEALEGQVQVPDAADEVDAADEQAPEQEREQEAKKADDAEDTAMDPYTYGFDEATGTAYRQSAAGKEVAVEIECVCGEEFISGLFQDGTKHIIDQCTVEKFCSLRTSARAVPPTQFWTGEHGVLHHRLTVTTKADRGLLAIVEEQGKQICQVRVALFGGEEEMHIKQSCEIMTEIAKSYSQDKIQKADLYKVRDSYLKERGLPTRMLKRKPDTPSTPASLVAPPENGKEGTNLTEQNRATVRKKPAAATAAADAAAAAAELEEVEDSGSSSSGSSGRTSSGSASASGGSHGGGSGSHGGGSGGGISS